MKQLFVLLCTLFWMYSVHARQFIVDTLKLNTAYRELVKDPMNRSSAKAFFEAFPKNWKEYINLYDFPKQKDGDKTMYLICREQLKAFQDKLWLIDKNNYYNRLIDLSIGAEWAVDAPSYLQDVLEHHMVLSMEDFMAVIAKRSSTEQKSFWSFYWTSQFSPESQKLFVTRFEKVLKDDFPKETAIMVQAYKDTRGKYKPAPGIYY